jgi:hypothetical protein
MYNCNDPLPFRQCFASYNVYLQTIAILSFSLFAGLVLCQTFFNFDFLPHKKEFRRIKKSSFVPAAISGYLIINEALAYFLGDMTQLAILDMSSVLLVVLFWFKDEQITEKMKLI